MPLAPRSNPHQFGRVDDDGTVWLISSAGERVVGSWQAGDREAAFAHFGRRFDDLSTEVTLMEERLAVGDRRRAQDQSQRVRADRNVADGVGAGRHRRGWRLGWPASSTRPGPPSPRIAPDATNTGPRRPPARRRWRPKPRSWPPTPTQWKTAGDRLREILDEWKTISGLDRKVDDALWKRYSAARESFNRRRGSHFADLDRERSSVRQSKERLCERAEELSDSTDWAGTSAEFRNLLTEWKAAGRASRDVDDAMWRRFKAAQDSFFSARNAATAEKDAEFHANADAKEALLADAEKIDTSNHEAARAALRSIADKWDAIGKVPRERSADLERRLRAVEKKVRDAGEANWADPEAQARAEQFATRAEHFEQQARKAAAAGRTKEAEEAQANADQWRQWAQAAVQALKR